MIELLHFAATRPVIVTLAIIGATMAMAAGLTRSRTAASGSGKLAALLHYGGYTLTGVSILLFIVAGFTSGR